MRGENTGLCIFLSSPGREIEASIQSAFLRARRSTMQPVVATIKRSRTTGSQHFTAADGSPITINLTARRVSFWLIYAARASQLRDTLKTPAKRIGKADRFTLLECRISSSDIDTRISDTLSNSARASRPEMLQARLNYVHKINP